MKQRDDIWVGEPIETEIGGVKGVGRVIYHKGGMCDIDFQPYDYEDYKYDDYEN